MSEINRPYSNFIMEMLFVSKNYRRIGDYARALQELYELIPFLEPDAQEQLADTEKMIEDTFQTIRRKTLPGSEFGLTLELNQKYQDKASQLLREATKKIIKCLFDAGYFEFEKGSYFHSPADGRKQQEKPSLGLGSTVRRDV